MPHTHTHTEEPCVWSSLDVVFDRTQCVYLLESHIQGGDDVCGSSSHLRLKSSRATFHPDKSLSSERWRQVESERKMTAREARNLPSAPSFHPPWTKISQQWTFQSQNHMDREQALPEVFWSHLRTRMLPVHLQPDPAEIRCQRRLKNILSHLACSLKLKFLAHGVTRKRLWIETQSAIHQNSIKHVYILRNPSHGGYKSSQKPTFCHKSRSIKWTETQSDTVFHDASNNPETDTVQPKL